MVSCVPKAPIGDIPGCTEGSAARAWGWAVTSSDNGRGRDGGRHGPGQTSPR